MRKLYAYLLLALLAFTFIPISISENAQATTGTIYASSDTYVNSGSADSNYDTSTALYLGKNGGAVKRFLMKFDLSSLAGMTVLSANLYVRIYNGATYPDYGDVYYNTADYTSSTVTWNNKPACTDTGVTSAAILAYGYNRWNITSLVSDWVSGAKSNYGITMISNQEGSNGYEVYFNSVETSGTTSDPYLSVIYTTSAWAVQVTNEPDTEAVVNETYSYTPTTNNTANMKAYSIPAWATNSSGTISGTPTETGDYDFTLWFYTVAGKSYTWLNWTVSVLNELIPDEYVNIAWDYQYNGPYNDTNPAQAQITVPYDYPTSGSSQYYVNVRYQSDIVYASVIYHANNSNSITRGSEYTIAKEAWFADTTVFTYFELVQCYSRLALTFNNDYAKKFHVYWLEVNPSAYTISVSKNVTVAYPEPTQMRYMRAMPVGLNNDSSDTVLVLNYRYDAYSYAYLYRVDYDRTRTGIVLLNMISGGYAQCEIEYRNQTSAFLAYNEIARIAYLNNSDSSDGLDLSSEKDLSNSGEYSFVWPMALTPIAASGGTHTALLVAQVEATGYLPAYACLSISSWTGNTTVVIGNWVIIQSQNVPYHSLAGTPVRECFVHAFDSFGLHGGLVNDKFIIYYYNLNSGHWYFANFSMDGLSPEFESGNYVDALDNAPSASDDLGYNFGLWAQSYRASNVMTVKSGSTWQIYFVEQSWTEWVEVQTIDITIGSGNSTWETVSTVDLIIDSESPSSDSITPNFSKGIVWLLGIFCLPILLGSKLGKLGWIIGMLLALTIFMFVDSSFTFVALMGYVGIGALWYRGG